jgi:hypothetical protein
MLLTRTWLKTEGFGTGWLEEAAYQAENGWLCTGCLALVLAAWNRLVTRTGLKRMTALF